ncbi:MAG: hypothetical protein BWY76_00997 [bacterium ADurb.Bin429]|nr:MAG: hypothetical protein BWY76_00997 [bacterium ADurb.Bin429]
MQHPQHPDLLVLSRFEAMDFTAEAPYAVISITDPETPPAVLKSPPSCRGVLRLQFHDITRPQDGYALMTEEHARQITAFVSAWRETVDLFVVHCEGGVSRSAAVAAALAWWWNGEIDHFFAEYLPNDYIYALMVQTLRGDASA